MSINNLKKLFQKTPTVSASGFTLVEIMVSVSIFMVVMVISSGSIITVFDANNKSQNLRVVMDNLNFTLEAMTRTIRFGTNYHCDITVGDPTAPRDCASGAVSMQVRASDDKNIAYGLSSSKIVRTTDGVDYDLTGSDITITNLTFRVFGSPAYNSGADLYQPQVIIVIGGYVGSKATAKSTFSLQTTVSQRQFDSQ